MCFARQVAAFLTATAVLFPVTAAQSAVEPPVNQPLVKAWSAVSGMSAQQVVDLATTLPAGVDDAGTPWCDATAEVTGTLQGEFGETLVAHNNDGLHLWGSEQMGTWTMVLARPDRTSCVVASGIGYTGDASPVAIFSTAGLI
ncbi:hypothetical protein [uncultured Paracoccus sp.]|uniref:hypothetical protein n=1 Tax=uncultured Paracoccus sp. TaxID=189685 RepID=UPI002602A0F2|nr:hypothetical protein [uncultured Paracoccus sp.]